MNETVMTAPMIEWTLEVLEWLQGQLAREWPSVKMRGSAPELTPEGYRVRFRDQGRQFWLNFSPDTITRISVSDVRTLLETHDWIRLLQDAGTLAVEASSEARPHPVLRPIPTFEVKLKAS